MSRNHPLIKHFILTVFLFFALSCSDSQQLAPVPSALELDDVKPTCSGITSLTVTAGPSLSVVWGQATDNFSQASAITYKIFVRKNAESYDLVSPAKIVSGATSTLVSTGISVGNTYTAFVTCTDEKGNTYPTGPIAEQSVSVIDSQAPSQVTSLVAGSATHTSILLTWSPSDDGTGGTTASNMRYSVYGGTASSVSTGGAALTTITGGTSYLHTGLNPGTPWFYKVVALDALSNRAPDSAEVTLTTSTDTTAPTFASGNPTITITATTSTSVNLSWTAATDDVTSAANMRYRVYRCTGSTTCDPFAGTLVTTNTGGILTLSDTGLIASTAYVYGIRAVDTTGNVSTNTGSKLTSTTYAASGTFYAYPVVDEVNIRAGTAVAVANVVGTATGATAYPDLIVGAPNASEPGSPWRYTGCVFVFAGTGTGTFSTTATNIFCQPSATVAGTVNGLNFGSAIAAGDIDADGHADIVVSAPLRSTVYIFRTAVSGGVLSIGTSSTTVTFANTTFGTGICLGDSDSVAGSGLDLFITVPSENCSVACGGVTATGNVQVYHNASTAGNYVVPSTLSYRISPTANLQASGYSIINSEVVARTCAFGKFDPNNTTQSQLVIGSGGVSFGAAASNDGAVAFYRKTGAGTFTYQNVFPTTTPAVTATRWGDALASIQVNTGTEELVVGAQADATVGAVAGAAFMYSVSTTSSNFSLTDLGDAFYGGTDFDNNGVGSAVAAADIWGHVKADSNDLRQDLVVAANLDDLTSTIGATLNLGQMYTYRNIAGTISANAQQSNFDHTGVRGKNDQQFGSALCKGDVNNDGYQDVIVGANSTDYDPIAAVNNTNIGAVHVYHGKASGEIDFVTPSQTIYAPGAQADSNFGTSCLVMDYNGDGKQDLLVGSPNRNIGALADRGVVYVYQGSTNTNLPSSNSASLNSPTATASAQFGWSLAKGDFDANGYDDLAVGAIGINSGAAASGRVYVYWADDTSHAITAASMVTLNPPTGALGSGGNPHLTNTQTISATMNFGRAMESFKTVNSSAGVDLVICSYLGDVALNELYAASPVAADVGKCWIYEGRTNGGLGSSYTMMTAPRNEIRFPNVPAASLQFGASITRGFWNADAVEDLIVCSARHTNIDTSVTLAGACFAYYGKAAGTGGFETGGGYNPNFGGLRFPPVPDDVHYNPNPEAVASRFGESVLLLDINNNSTHDLIVGEPASDNPTSTTNLSFDSGRLYIIRGGY